MPHEVIAFYCFQQNNEMKTLIINALFNIYLCLCQCDVFKASPSFQNILIMNVFDISSAFCSIFCLTYDLLKDWDLCFQLNQVGKYKQERCVEK